jgi:hypothetical protein
MTDPTQDYRGRHVAPPLHGLKLGLAALLLALALPSGFLMLFALTANASGREVDGTVVVGWILFGYFAIAPALILGAFALRKNRVLGKILGALGMLIAAFVIAYHLWSVFVNEGYVLL